MSKKNIILGSVLVVLIAIAFIYKGPWQDWKQKVNKPKNIFTKIKLDNLDKIEFVIGSNNLTVEKKDGTWKINGAKNFLANQSTVDSFKSKIEELVKSDFEIISENKNNKKEYLTDNSGIKVVLSEGDKKIIDFIVGKSSGDGCYMSLPNIDQTYLYKTDITSFTSDTDQWYDKTMFTGNKDSINHIRFQYPDSEFTVEKKGDKWEGVLPYKFNVNKDKLTKVLDIMSNLNAVSIPMQDYKPSGLDKHLIIIQSSGIGINNTLMVGVKDKNGYYYAKKGDSDNLYLITKEQRDELVKKITDLK